MKQIFTLLLLLAATAGFAQNEKYARAMQERLQGLDTIRNAATLRDLSAAFERIATAEKDKWQPYYYASLALVNAGYAQMSGSQPPQPAAVDPLADKAEQLLAAAEALSKDNSEIFLVKKMIYTLRMFVDPMNRYMQYGPVAAQALETARKLNPENPRVYILEAQDKFFTPEQFGGSKVEAKKLFQTALQKHEAFQPKGELDPVWGKAVIHYFLNQLK